MDVLAIESNYCPRLQATSGRPWFLRQRITGGRGHLSNHECVAAVAAIDPGTHVVLLHLSRQCNNPKLAGAGHRARGYELTITSQRHPTPWIPILNRRPRPARPVPTVYAPLFEMHMRSSHAGLAD